MKLYVDINNGGFIQFFCNWGFQCLCYVMRGLKCIENTSLYDLLADEDEERLNATDTQFYETECERFTKMAYEYYHQTLKKMVTPLEI